jgi:mRNA interferase RelE/StbE
MSYAVKLHREVAKTLAVMNAKTRSRIVRTLPVLQNDPFQPRSGADIVRLKGTRVRQDLFRPRIGDYLAIYAVEDSVVYVTDVFHRGKGYWQTR